MASVIIMPKQGLLMEEGTITKWLAKEGEQTTEGAPLFEMETDKLTITMDSTATGTVLKILHPEGDTVPITQPIAIVGQPGEDISGLLGGEAPAAAPAAAAPEVTASPEEAAAAPAAADTAVTYPLTVTDQLGREVTIETEPKTLASGYYISTSLLIALGVQDELVGVEAKADKRTIYSLSAPELQSLPSIGTAKEFDLEGCAALTPDLVIVPAKLKDSIPQMEELGLTVLAVKPEDQDKLYGAIDLLAQATNTVARGEALKSAIEDNLLSLREAIGDAEAPTVYMAGNSSVLQTAGPAMYQNYMIENAGGLNAAASVEDTYWAEVSYEQVLDWDPDYIILASDADYDVDSVLNDAALADCTAVKEGHVYQLPHAIEAVDSPVPGSFLGSVYLGSVLHPEQVSEQFYHDCADAFYTAYYGFTPASYE